MRSQALQLDAPHSSHSTLCALHNTFAHLLHSITQLPQRTFAVHSEHVIVQYNLRI